MIGTTADDREADCCAVPAADLKGKFRANDIGAERIVAEQLCQRSRFQRSGTTTLHVGVLQSSMVCR